MPSVADEPCHGGARAAACRGVVAVPCKKRRWDDSRSSDAGGHSHSGDALVSLLLPDDGLGRKLAAATTTTPTTSLRNPSSPSQRKMVMPSKRLRFSCDSSSDDGRRAVKDTPSTTTPHPAMLACHVCQRKPRRKTDLDSQADCDGCGQRTCFVCLRECPGWSADACEATTPTTTDEEEHGDMVFGRRSTSPRPWSATSRGHRRIVCSRCCVERGQDGDVVCLGCMAS